MFVPNDAGTPEELLGKLKDEFNLSQLIVEALLKEQIQNMEEFRFFWDEETKIGTWCSKLRLGDDANVHAARLRRAWNAVYRVVLPPVRAQVQSRGIRLGLTVG